MESVMVRRLAPWLLAVWLSLPPALVVAADTETADSSASTTSTEEPARHQTNLSGLVCRISWKLAWEVPGAGGLALGACLYAIHLDLEDYFSPGRP
jgi:hypothetical protein